MSVLWRGSVLQRARLAAGLVLFAFALTHFLNHALGLVSLDAMLVAEDWRTAVTGSRPGTAILLAALILHVALSLAKLARRRSWRVPIWEAAQIGSGLAIPFLLLPHIVGARLPYELFGIDTGYAYQIVRIWPDAMLRQSLLLLLVWGHGCLGLHYWLRLTPAYRRALPALVPLALLIPMAAILGVLVQGRTKDIDLDLAARFDAPDVAARWPLAPPPPLVGDVTQIAVWGFAGVLALVAIVMVARYVAGRLGRRIAIQYLGGPLVRTMRGPTLLEISRQYGVPHMSVCGGRGRCSTCRVLVLAGESGLDAPNEVERATLRQIGAAANVRLACQTRPRAGVTLTPLLQVDPAHAAERLVAQNDVAGVERDVAILFIDIRGFTPLTEQKLAYDIVFILNRFFAAVGRPIYDQGGWIGNYAGDGVMALFAHERSLDEACRNAIEATIRITQAIADLNTALGAELPRPLRVAMGLHSGPLVLGRLGYGDTMAMSVVGSAVNVASRLESLAKAADAELVVSHATAVRAGLDMTGLASQSVAIRGSSSDLDVLYVMRAADLEPARVPA